MWKAILPKNVLIEETFDAHNTYKAFLLTMWNCIYDDFRTEEN